MILFLRMVGVFLSIGHFLGFIMFWNTNQIMSIGIPLSLMILSLANKKNIRATLFLLIIPAILIVLSYSIAGIPFLNKEDDAVARFLHFIELLLIFTFSLNLILKKNVTV